MPEFIIALSIVILLILLIVLVLICRNINAKKRVKSELEEIFDCVSDSNIKGTDFVCQSNDKNYLIKVIYNFSKAEINVNSKNYWQINRGTVSSRKSGEQMKNVYDLLNTNFDGIRVHIIYPGSKRLMKVINECEMVMIDPKTDIYGTRIIPFDKLAEQLKEII